MWAGEALRSGHVGAGAAPDASASIPDAFAASAQLVETPPREGQDIGLSTPASASGTGAMFGSAWQTDAAGSPKGPSPVSGRNSGAVAHSPISGPSGRAEREQDSGGGRGRGSWASDSAHRHPQQRAGPAAADRQHGRPAVAPAASRSQQLAGGHSLGGERNRLIAETLQRKKDALTQRRMRKMQQEEDERRRRLTISRHLKQKADEADEKEREAARADVARAQREAARERRFAGLLESLEAGSAICQRLEAKTLGRHDKGKRRQLEQLHRRWQEDVADKVTGALVSHVEKVPVRQRRMERVAQSDAYNREAEQGAVFVGSKPGGKTGYDPFRFSQGPVVLSGGVRDPTKTSLMRGAKEAKQTLDSRLPAAAAEALGLRSRTQLPRHKLPPPASAAGGAYGASGSGRAPATGPAAERMRASIVPPPTWAPAGSTAVLFEADTSLPRAAVSSSPRRRRQARGTSRASSRGSARPGSTARSVGAEARPQSAHSAARALHRSERGSEAAVAAAIRKAVEESGTGRQLSDAEARDIAAALQRSQAAGKTEGKWTLPPSTWGTGFIEEMAFVRNWPLPGDSRRRTSEAARGRGPTLGRKHELVLGAVEAGEAAAAQQRERVLPSWFEAEVRDNAEAGVSSQREFGRGGRRHMLAPGAAKRTTADLLPVDTSAVMPSRSGVGAAAYHGAGLVVVERAGGLPAE